MTELIVNRRKYFDQKNQKRVGMLETKPVEDGWHTQAHCLNCNHVWELRVDDPKNCPRCGYRFIGAKKW